MFCAKLLKRQFKLLKLRQLNTSSINKDKPAPVDPIKEPNAKLNDETMGVTTVWHNVSNFDRRLLVWVKRYPSMDKVPAKVTNECMKTATTKARIKVCNIMIVITIIAYIIAAISGKREAHAGRHIISDRMNYINKLKAESAEAKAKAEKS